MKLHLVDFIPAALLIGAILLWLLLARLGWMFKKNLAVTYRAKFIQVVALFETNTKLANLLYGPVAASNDGGLLIQFEKALKLYETLLSAVCQLYPFAFDNDSLKAILHLGKDAEKHLCAVAARLKFKNPHFNPEAEILEESIPESIGCFFCSKPFHAGSFATVKIKVEGKFLTVVGCRVCTTSLRLNKKLNILYFLRNGKPMHWSQCPEYNPATDYWSFQKKKDERKSDGRKHLTLVYSQSAYMAEE